MSQRLTYRTAGESHGPTVLALVEGFPAGVAVDLPLIDTELQRRQGGYGRGGRMKIEHDQVTVLSGVRRGVTIGSPIALQVPNKDSRIDEAPDISRPRPGHADLAGMLKWLTPSARPVLERASARETTARVAAGALARCLLNAFGIEVVGFVAGLGPVEAAVPLDLSPADLAAARDANEVYCPDASAVEAMIDVIHQAKKDGDTVGGTLEVRAVNVPPGLGNCMAWQDKLDARIAYAVMGIQAIKAVQIGLGVEAGRLPGSQVHDEIGFDPAREGEAACGFVRYSDNDGGTEGGMSTGQPIRVRATMKPIATLLKPLRSVDLLTRTEDKAAYERSDVCAVPAASVVVENVVAFELAAALCDKFACDTLAEMRASYNFYLDQVRRLGRE
ncbi:MAG: Chorismate synthase [Phycisphaerae bacterium]|nr:Chorismate synthase [Phycisphaerae bacterium]